MRCAHIVNGVVTNTMEADPTTFTYGDGSLVVATATAQVGDTYANGTFTTVTPPTVYQTTGLDFVAFLGLFTPAEQAAVVGSNDVQTRIFLAMATGSPTIDLTDTRVIAGVNYLAAIKLISTSRVATILSGQGTN